MKAGGCRRCDSLKRGLLTLAQNPNLTLERQYLLLQAIRTYCSTSRQHERIVIALLLEPYNASHYQGGPAIQDRVPVNLFHRDGPHLSIDC
ncbi:protein of unknown function [Nitrospira japonica]|uniref:Uncharacterized protein n=1 Tax=Nitrospira japonica TaxID=1325564 RepID=A0A1W1I1P3_9BACT|nr:protein of unknown function [Nitrospira japonica]